jgi:imidazolonepropionase-like amidohydrolase
MATAFTGVTVVPMDADRVVPGQTVLVEGDQITRMGPEHEARLPAAARRVNGRGRFLMPGLADMHAHPVNEGDLLLLLAHGVTTVRNLWGMPRHLAWRDRVAAGALLGPTIHTAGPIVDGRPVRNAWSVSVTTPEEAARAVLDTKRYGYEAVKVYDQLTPDAYRWLVAAAREQRLPVVGHVPFLVGLQAALDAGQRSIEHLYGYLEALQPEPRRARQRPPNLAQMRVALLESAQRAREDLIPELAEATRAAATWNCPTLLVRRRWLEDPELLMRRPETRYLSPIQAEHWRKFTSSYPTDPRRARVCAINSRLTRALSDAGARLLLGTDAGVPGLLPGASLHEELAAFVEAGLTPFQALRAGTADAAEFLGAAGGAGVVAVGARADLLLLEANPLTDVANAARLAGVMARGRWLPADDLRGRLDDLAASRGSTRPPSLRRPAPPRRSVPETMTLRFRLEREGHSLGAEQLTIEPREGGGRCLLTSAAIELFGFQLSAGWEAGSYQAVVEVDQHDRDQAAEFTHDGLDGPQRVEIVRENGQAWVRRTEPLAGGHEELVEAADDLLFASPLISLYARLGPRLTHLAVGQRARLRLIGPGLPPDPTVGASTVSAQRLPDPADRDGSRRFAFELERANARYTGTLTCDGDSLPIQLELAGSPPIRVSRSAV